MNSTITIYRPDSSELLTVTFDTGSYRRWQVMGEHAVTLNFSLPQTQGGGAMLEIPVLSYIMYQGRRYTLYNPGDFTKHANRNYAYTLKLYAWQELLNDRVFINEPDGMQVFPRTARPEEFLEAIVRNMNNFDTGDWDSTEWTAGQCITSNVQQTVQFNGVSVYEALRLIASAFKTEWEVTDKVISLHKVEYNKTSPLTLEYGMDKGLLPGLGRTNYDQARPVHKLYVKGGERNISFSTYGARNLHMPKNTAIGYDGTYFDDEPGFNSSIARTYQTDATGESLTRINATQLSRREAFIELAEAYPHHVGTVTGIEWSYNGTVYPAYAAAKAAAEADNKDAGSVFCDVFDTTIPNELNYANMRTGGEQMIFVPQTGRLSGVELGVQQGTENASDGYIHSERRFKLMTDALNGGFVPDSRLAVGDTYAIFGIDFNKDEDNTALQTYISTGERDLLKEAVRYKYGNEDMRFTFKGTMDGIWAQKNWTALNLNQKIVAGGYINFIDPQFQPEGVFIRISAIKEYLHQPCKPEIELTNVVTGGGIRGELAQIPQQEVVLNEQEREIKRLEQRRWRDVEELKENLGNVFTEFSEAITPVSVHSMQYIAGNPMGQFRFISGLNTNTPAANAPTIVYNAENNTVTVAGNTPGAVAYIQHQTLGIDNLDGKSSSGSGGTLVRPASEYKQWSLQPYQSATLEKDKFYWIYARVSKTGNTGTFLAETTARTVFEDSSYYYLVVGGLNSEHDGTRSFSPLFGFTEILPGQITTGTIRSSNGVNWFDLVNGRFHVGNSSNFIDWNNYNSNALTLRGALVQSQSGANDYMGVFRGDWSSSTQYYTWDEVTYNGVTYRCINNSYGLNPQSNPSYWQPRDADPMILYRGEYDSSKTYQGTRLERNVVKYNGQYYISNIVNASLPNTAPTNTQYWTLYGANFEMVATNLLLAQTAIIENLIVNKISTDALPSSPRLKADGEEIAYYLNEAQEISKDNARIRMGIGVSELGGTLNDKCGMIIRAIDDNELMSEISAAGVYSSGSNINKDGYNCSVLGELIAYKPSSVNAAIAGIDNMGNDVLPTFGGYFNTLLSDGAHFGCIKTYNYNTYLTKTDTIVSCNNTSAITVYLPQSPQVGKFFIIKRCNAGVAIDTNSNSVNIYTNSNKGRNVPLGSGNNTTGVFWYDGSYWQMTTFSGG